MAQTAFNSLMTGNAFKRMENGEMAAPLRPLCNEEPFQWPHFFSCFKLSEIAINEWEDPGVLAGLARSIASFPMTAISHVRL